MSTAPREAQAIDVARYLIRLAASESEPEYMSAMRLQKLLYYIQGWHLGLQDRPLFRERIQAWTYGPVVPEVFKIFRSYGDAPISTDEGSSENLSDHQKEFIAAVWEAYKAYSAVKLSQMTHEETPWREARAGIPPGDRSRVEIPRESLKRYFKSLTSD
jgi:uncharacterized phage-associated protein